MTQSIGSNYQVTIPALSDNASIVEALKYYHQGGLTGSPATNSVEKYLIDINSRATALESAVGWPYSNASSLDSRLSGLETTVGSGLESKYVKSTPASDGDAATRNFIQPANTSTIPLQIQGLSGHNTDLQQWRVSTNVLAKIDKDGKLFSYNGLVSGGPAEVVTISGTQTLTNKTLSSPIQTIGTNSKTTSYTLEATDQSKIIEVNSASGTTITIPNESVTTIFPVGTYILVIQMGAGQVTIAGSGFTPLATPGLKIRTQYSMATLIKRGTNSWIVGGDLTA